MGLLTKETLKHVKNTFSIIKTIEQPFRPHSTAFKPAMFLCTIHKHKWFDGDACLQKPCTYQNHYFSICTDQNQITCLFKLILSIFGGLNLA
jgi:hypothetical protein